MSDKLQLVSDNAIETMENSKVISKSLLAFFKQCCFDGEKVEPKDMDYDYTMARVDDYDIDEVVLERESCSIKFDESPALCLTRKNEVERITEKKTRTVTGYASRWEKLWRGKNAGSHEEEYESFVRNEVKSSEFTLSHGDLNLSLTEKQYTVLGDFFREQKETKKMNTEIESLSARLDKFGVKNPIKAKAKAKPKAKK